MKVKPNILFFVFIGLLALGLITTTMNFCFNTTAAEQSVAHKIMNGSLSNYVTYDESSNPIACFTYSPQDPLPNETILFDASCSHDLDGTITDYYWSYTTIGSPHFPIAMGHGETISYSWDKENEYSVMLEVTDNESNTDTISEIISVEENQPPYTPAVPSGPITGYTDEMYSYSTSGFDTDDDSIKYFFDWGDGSGNWTSFVSSSTLVELSHVWNTADVYQVRVKAEDEHGAQSDWSSEISVNISHRSLNADLICSDSMNWVDVRPGSIVHSNFTVENNGDHGSLLNWNIVSYPSWGDWTFIPDNGNDVLPSDDPVIVEVFVFSPDIKETSFTGEIMVINEDNSSDYELISVSLATPKNTCCINPLFRLLFNRYPLLSLLFE